MSKVYPYLYNKQIEKFTGQFMRVFSGFQTQDGVTRNQNSFGATSNPKTQVVPVVYGAMDRIVATVLQKRDSFQSNRVPMMAVNLSAIEPDAERKKSHRHIDSITYQDSDGTKRGVDRIIGPPFRLRYELTIYASSTSELLSILEQILLIFNPRITIQTDNNVFNSDYISEITLESISNEIQYPMGTNHQVVLTTLNFTVPVRLRYPYNPDASYIEEIRANVFSRTMEGIVDENPFETIVVKDEEE